jgi:hypothetical protein
MQKHVNILALALLFLSSVKIINAEEHDSPEYVQYADEIIHSFEKQIKKEFGFKCEASGGSMPYDVEKISMKFVANRCATIEEARELEVKITEKFIKCINAHEKIRPFLREYPFTVDRATVMISFNIPKKFSLSNDYVEVVFQGKSTIYYNATNRKNPNIYDTLKKEPYEEALRIVQSKTAP